ncbi:MAG TPA: SRPBCC family protein [Candidatus Binataceae bacterium]|nr:SRPBCC family protein [Candidatus Binataceae bacterium]
MNFKQTCTIPVARAELWRFLMDVPQMAKCVPGVEEVINEGNDQYRGRLKVKLGPISLNLQGAVAIKERDEQNWRAVAKAEAKDRRIGGGTDVSATMTLVEEAPDLTRLSIDASARFLGKLGEFGEPIIRKQTDATIAAFARNVAAHFQVTTPAPQVAAPSPVVAPAGAPAAPTVAPPPTPARMPAPAAPAPPAQPAGYWMGKVAGLGASVVLWLSVPIPPGGPPAWLRISAVTLALVVIGDLGERIVRRARHSTT